MKKSLAEKLVESRGDHRSLPERGRDAVAGGRGRIDDCRFLIVDFGLEEDEGAGA